MKDAELNSAGRYGNKKQLAIFNWRVAITSQYFQFVTLNLFQGPLPHDRY